MVDPLDVPDSHLFTEYVHESEVAELPVTVRFRINNEPDPPTAIPVLESFFSRVSAALDGAEGGPLDALRRGMFDEVDAPPLMVSLLQQVVQVREMTGGLVDPWRAPEGFLFRGWFRGWVAQQVQNRCAPAGYWNVHVTFGRVNSYHGERGHAVPWVVKVPFATPDGGASFDYVPSGDGALVVVDSTSGLINPGTLEPAPEGRAVAVFGPDAAHADAFASAIGVGGRETAEWVASRYPGYGLLLSDSGAVYGYGEIADCYTPNIHPDS